MNWLRKEYRNIFFRYNMQNLSVPDFDLKLRCNYLELEAVIHSDRQVLPQQKEEKSRNLK